MGVAEVALGDSGWAMVGAACAGGQGEKVAKTRLYRERKEA